MVSSLKSWNDLALQYLQSGQNDIFVSTLQRIIQDELPKREYDSEDDVACKVQILNNMAAFYLHLSSKEHDKKKKQDLIDQVTLYINKSDRININESISFSLKGFLLYFN